MAVQQMIQLTLDVSKAHRRILVVKEDGGLLCFHADGELYRCITLNFGARARDGTGDAWLESWSALATLSWPMGMRSGSTLTAC